MSKLSLGVQKEAARLSAMTGPADVRDARRLAELEKTIQAGIASFVAVGEALIEVRQSKLYRIGYATFEAYCQGRWGWTADHSKRLMDAAHVVHILPTGRNPDNEWQARELAPLKDQPEAVRDVWAGVVERAEATDEPITGPVIRNAVRDYIRGQAASAEAELQQATAGMSPEQRTGYQPELVRQRGELSRLVSDVAKLPEPAGFIAAHRGFLPPQTVEQARLAHEWLGRFLEGWRKGNGN